MSSSDEEEPAVPVDAPGTGGPLREGEVTGKKVEEPAPPVNTCSDVAGAMAKATATKALGNEAFGRGELAEALRHYDEAVEASEGCDGEKERAVFFANRAAVYLAEHRAAEAAADCDRALRIDPAYVKCLVRRAQAREKLEKLEEALADHKKAAELGAGSSAREVARLEPIVKERQEKQTAEMMAQLKGLGNTILGKFGLSLDNFQLQKDEKTGSYSVQFNK